MFGALDQEKISQLRTYTSFWFSPSCTVNFGSLDASLHVHLETLLICVYLFCILIMHL